MINIWTSLKKHKNIFFFLSIIIFIGIISGFIYFYKVNDSIIINLKTNLTNLSFESNIIFHIIFLAIILFFSLLIIGPFIGIFFAFYEALSIGFVFGVYYSTMGLSGLMYSVMYILLYKTVYLLLLTKILVASFAVSRNIVGYFLFKKENSLKDSAISNFLVIIKYSIIILLYDLFLIFFGNNIISIFNFLI